jgi:hypothetical protein
MIQATLLLCIALLSPLSVSAQTGSDLRNYELRLSAQEDRFSGYTQDFADFMASGSRDDFEAATGLNKIAVETFYHVHSVFILLKIYDALSVESEREFARSLIERELNFYSTQVDRSINEANINIAHTRIASVANEAIRMRDDLRDTKSIFDSIRVN